MLTGHGDDGYRWSLPIRANFSSNVRRNEPLREELRAHLAERFACVSLYPEPAAESLVALLAEREGIARENMVVTNGAVAALYLIAQAFRTRRSCVIIPTFSEYEDACRLHGHRLEFRTRTQWEEGDLPAGDLLWLCNPNNPTGEVYARERLLALIDARPGCLHVLDLAYQDFSDETAVNAKDVCGRSNVVVVRSLTKRAGLPGLRLGCVIGPARAVRSLRSQLIPWSVDALALEAGKYLCQRFFPCPIQEELAAAERLRVAINGLKDFTAHRSRTPYFLMQLASTRSGELKASLLRKHGLLIRDASNFRGLNERFVRISAQSEVENSWLVEALSS